MSGATKGLKRKCTFNSDLEKEFPHIEKRKHAGDDHSGVYCKLCEKTFSIANGGRSNIVHHNDSVLHKQNAKSKAASQPVTSFFRPVRASAEDLELAAKEGVIAFHTVKHDQSFKSLECTSKLISSMFNKKFSCSRTKCTAIAASVLYPHEVEGLKKELEFVQYVNVAVDCSNHKAIKLMPVTARYFTKEKGVCQRLLEIHSLEGETSDLMIDKLMDTLEKFKLTKKVVGFCADNANVNFGGRWRNGTNNMFFKLKKRTNNENLTGIGCAAHIVHNGVAAAADLIPVDIESILRKIYNHFSIYTLRNEKLKDYCEFVNVEFKVILSTCRTRWLSLGPALDRTLQLYDALKSYFISEHNAVVLEKFFQDSSARLYMLFLQNQLPVFTETILKIQKDDVSAVEVSQALQQLIITLEARKNETFVGVRAKSLLKELMDNGEVNESQFLTTVNQFFETAISYIKTWKSPMEELTVLQWTMLSEKISWESIENSLPFFNSKGVELDDGRLFDEFALMDSFCSLEKINDWRFRNVAVQDRWIEMFRHFTKQSINFDNIFKIVSFTLCMPGSNAHVERIFSLVNNFWSSDKSNLSVSTLEAAVWLKVNVQMTCQQFHEYLKQNSAILQEIHSSEKYLPKQT